MRDIEPDIFLVELATMSKVVGNDGQHIASHRNDCRQSSTAMRIVSVVTATEWLQTQYVAAAIETRQPTAGEQIGADRQTVECAYEA